MCNYETPTLATWQLSYLSSFPHTNLLNDMAPELWVWFLFCQQSVTHRHRQKLQLWNVRHSWRAVGVFGVWSSAAPQAGVTLCLPIHCNNGHVTNL